jgi:hypothetical protein
VTESNGDELRQSFEDLQVETLHALYESIKSIADRCDWSSGKWSDSDPTPAQAAYLASAAQLISVIESSIRKTSPSSGALPSGLKQKSRFKQ